MANNEPPIDKSGQERLDEFFPHRERPTGAKSLYDQVGALMEAEGLTTDTSGESNTDESGTGQTVAASLGKLISENPQLSAAHAEKMDEPTAERIFVAGADGLEVKPAPHTETREDNSNAAGFTTEFAAIMAKGPEALTPADVETLKGLRTRIESAVSDADQRHAGSIMETDQAKDLRNASEIEPNAPGAAAVRDRTSKERSARHASNKLVTLLEQVDTQIAGALARFNTIAQAAPAKAEAPAPAAEPAAQEAPAPAEKTPASQGFTTYHVARGREVLAAVMKSRGAKIAKDVARRGIGLVNIKNWRAKPTETSVPKDNATRSEPTSNNGDKDNPAAQLPATGGKPGNDALGVTPAPTGGNGSSSRLGSSGAGLSNTATLFTLIGLTAAGVVGMSYAAPAVASALYPSALSLSLGEQTAGWLAGLASAAAVGAGIYAFVPRAVAGVWSAITGFVKTAIGGLFGRGLRTA